MQSQINNRDRLTYLIIGSIAILTALFLAQARSATGIEANLSGGSGGIIYVNGNSCPTGWTEATETEGRYIVGLPSGGMLGGIVGTALRDQENRPVGQHDHAVTDPGHSHTVTDPGHAHSVIDLGHSHGVNDPGHTHPLADNLRERGNDGDDNGSPRFSSTSFQSDSATTGISVENGQANVTLTTDQTGLTLFNNTTGITINNEGTTVGTNAPYMQLLICKQS